jgi:ABC-2 type transport system ATP-binding protein
LVYGKRMRSGDPFFNQVGYLVETPYAYPNLTVIENLDIYYRYRNMKDHRLVEQTIHRLDLYNYRNVQAKNLSLGNKQRLGLAKALFHNPRLLILDEPTNGLDPAGIVQVRAMLQTLSSEGITIFVSSHLLAEVTKLASRLGIIHNGKLKREIYMKDLRSEISQSLIIKVGDLARAQKVLYDAGYTFTMDDQLECLKSTDTVTIGSSKDVCATLVHAGLTPEEIYMEGEDLESYFLRQIT